MKQALPAISLSGPIPGYNKLWHIPLEQSGSAELPLRLLTGQLLGNRRLLMVSNRGPYTYQQTADGKVSGKRGSGGVVTALGTVFRYAPVTWVAAAISQTDHSLSRSPAPVEASTKLRLKFVSIAEETYHSYLNVISNPLLWFIQHGMGNLLKSTSLRSEVWRHWQDGYTRANLLFARAVLEEARRKDTAPIVIFHDYQLYLAPGMVRVRRPDLKLLHFTHIPWPEPDAWEALPEWMVKSICRSLLACDITGFQTPADVRAFVRTCQRFLKGIQVIEGQDGSFQIENEQATTLARAYPVSVDPLQVRQTFLSVETQAWVKQLAILRQGLDNLIVRVDRLDPSKNIIGGFEAFAALLAKRPDLHRKVTLLANLVPTREGVAEYGEYREKTFSLIEQINRRYGKEDWRPIHLFYGNDYNRSLAAMSLADAMLVNPLADGMNLVAKEMALVNGQNGVLILSKKAGAWQELNEAALGIDPRSIKGTTEAMEKALAMSLAERQNRSEKLQQVVVRNELTSWLSNQFLDLYRLNRPVTNLIGAQG